MDRRPARIGALFLANAVLALAAIAAAGAAVEAYFRLFSPQIMQHDSMFEYDAELGWRFLPNREGYILHRGEAAQTIRTNAHGFRDGPFGDRAEGMRRMLVIGDSFVSNIAVEPDYYYPITTACE